MDQACSSSTPLPLLGMVRLLLFPLLSVLPCWDPPFYVRLLRVFPDWRAPSSLLLSLLWIGGPPPLTLSCAVHEERTLLFRGCPPLPFLFGGRPPPLPLPLPQVVR